MAEYDFVVVGAGMFGAVFAREATDRGRKVLVIEKRPHIGGNCYTERREGIDVHVYGPHIFHTSDERAWEYVRRFAQFNHFVNRPKVRYRDKLYSFPINLMTLHQLWGVRTPAEAEKKLREAAVACDNPENLEQWILSQVGPEIYEIFVKGYTKKQWGREPRELPASIIQRLPIRLTFDDNYYRDRYQGIPAGGYTRLFERMLEGIEVRLNTDYFADSEKWNAAAAMLVYTGRADEYFGYRFGELEYRGLRFESRTFEGDYQGNAVVNYAEGRIPYTRVVEHKHFDFRGQPGTVVTWEYPDDYDRTKVAYYPVNDERNNALYERYKREAAGDEGLILAGRLGTYRYLDMDEAVTAAMATIQDLM
ncbi:MAG: UDP-galactopyranose mutase [Phycisphaerales bacterium]|nr:MAG: UDP-galactopyranose mutase [Phycisphaerales bacterium]